MFGGEEEREEESRGTRRGEGLQRGAELPGKEKEKKKEKLKGKEKERRREKGVSDKDKYNFKDSGIGDSWLIGNEMGHLVRTPINFAQLLLAACTSVFFWVNRHSIS